MRIGERISSTVLSVGCRLDGRVAVVTGTSRGIGKAIAELFAAEGASVAGVGHGERQRDAVAREDEVALLVREAPVQADGEGAVAARQLGRPRVRGNGAFLRRTQLARYGAAPA